MFSKRWNTVVWDRFDIENVENALHSPATALRERARMSLLGTSADPFYELDNDVSTTSSSGFRCTFSSTPKGGTGWDLLVLHQTCSCCLSRSLVYTFSL